ncbi:Hypothetical predicted protein [Xyrichtys novacula]|uniref:Uncharacterized protein n=1 Tax=Xyrichtys novacula TaxID=13765 RepID=A0AAV1H7L0_XYRNO|nr:Hypothetical predicted protein [Xyrichtys novacula]
MELQLLDSDEDLYKEPFQASYPSPESSNQTTATHHCGAARAPCAPRNIIPTVPIRSPATSPPRRSVDQRSYNLNNLICSPPRRSHRSATGNLTSRGVASLRRPTPRSLPEDDISNGLLPASVDP